MKGLIFTRVFMVLCFPFFVGLATVSAQDLKTQKDKESYSIGYEVGYSMRSDGVEINLEKLVRGLEDVLGQKEPLLDTKEMRKIVIDLRKRVREIQLRKIQEQSIKNAEESEKFLEENKKKEGVQITDSGLQYRVVKAGDGISPGPEDLVKVNYRGTFIDDREFDSSYAKGQPAMLQVDSVIKGWAEALPMMKTGSKWQLFVPPELAYGKRGHGQQIPPNTALVFDIELLAVEKAAAVDGQGKDQTGRELPVRTMTLRGEIGKSKHGYIIRSKKGDIYSEIFTILNEDPGILDKFVKSEKIILIEVQVIAGDNVDIMRIDGKDYRPSTRRQDKNEGV